MLVGWRPVQGPGSAAARGPRSPAHTVGVAPEGDSVYFFFLPSVLFFILVVRVEEVKASKWPGGLCRGSVPGRRTIAKD